MELQAGRTRFHIQIIADHLGVDVVRPTLGETTAIGAAYLAGLAEGVWSTVTEVSDRWMIDRRFEPAADRGTVDVSHDQWRRAVGRSSHHGD